MLKFNFAYKTLHFVIYNFISIFRLFLDAETEKYSILLKKPIVLPYFQGIAFFMKFLWILKSRLLNKNKCKYHICVYIHM